MAFQNPAGRQRGFGCRQRLSTRYTLAQVEEFGIEQVPRTGSIAAVAVPGQARQGSIRWSGMRLRTQRIEPVFFEFPRQEIAQGRESRGCRCLAGEITNHADAHRVIVLAAEMRPAHIVLCHAGAALRIAAGEDAAVACDEVIVANIVPAVHFRMQEVVAAHHGGVVRVEGAARAVVHYGMARGRGNRIGLRSCQSGPPYRLRYNTIGHGIDQSLCVFRLTRIDAVPVVLPGVAENEVQGSLSTGENQFALCKLLRPVWISLQFLPGSRLQHPERAVPLAVKPAQGPGAAAGGQPESEFLAAVSGGNSPFLLPDASRLSP